MAGYKGFYYHFLHMDTGLRFGTSELSTVDTALLLGGVLLAQTLLRSRHALGARDPRARRDDLRAASIGPGRRTGHRRSRTAGGRSPDSCASTGAATTRRMLVYILALGSPTHPVEDEAWEAWTQTYKDHWGTFSGQEYLSFGPLFGHQYSHVWIDFRGIQDEYMREKGIDYFENSRRAVLRAARVCASRIRCAGAATTVRSGA